MYLHFKDRHSAEELAKWGINKEILQYSAQQGYEKLPEHFIVKQLNRFRPPILQCEEKYEVSAQAK